MTPLVDWFCASFKALKFFDCFFAYFSLKKEDFQEISGRWNYHHGLWQQGITIYYSEVESNVGTAYYDVCINFSGSGCRKYETLRGLSFDWISFIDSLMSAYKGRINISRVDVALDVKDDSVPSMLGIIKLVDAHKYISQFRRVVSGRGSEEWVYFGSPTSDTRLRIYNKALERGFVSDKWVRFEYQFRNQAADRFLNHLLTCRNLGQAFKDFINSSVTFTTKPNLPNCSVLYNTHTSRLNPAAWWKKFVKGAGQITKFEVVGVEYNYTALQKYIDLQAGPSLYAFISANGGDIGPLLSLIERQKYRLNDKQRSVISERQSELRRS